MLKFWHWSLETWAFVVAATALVQPWLVSLWRRIASMIDIYETPFVEIGFSTFGPTLGLFGTLRSRNRDLFIHTIYLTLSRQEDKFSRRFEWGVFRTAKATIGQTTKSGVDQAGEVSMDVPNGFMISTAQPYRYNILFIDPIIFHQQLKPILAEFRTSWLSHLDQANIIPSKEMLLNVPLDRKIMMSLKREFEEFITKADYANVFDRINELFYWTPGAYELTIHVKAAHPNRHYRKSWFILLNESDVTSLRQQNIVSILEEVCGIPLSAGQYGFIYTPYLSKLDKKAP